MSRLIVEPIPLLKDNYAWLLRDPISGAVAVIDPSEASPVIGVLEERGLSLQMVINTHHHWDHVGGNAGLKERFACAVLGPSYDQHRLAGLTGVLSDGDELRVGDRVAKILHIPGHTLGHIALWFEQDEAVFVGDTLFSLGCGRLFEGTPEDMHRSLSLLRALPGGTNVYCGHEYTEANARFALTVDPGNQELLARADKVRDLRAAGKPTVPSLMAEEILCNPFLRAGTVERFAALRRAKDVFV